MRRVAFTTALAITIVNLAAPAKVSADGASMRLDVRIHRHRAMLDVSIDGHPAHMVLDTGASQTLLMADAPGRLGLPPADDHPPEQRMSYGQPFQVRFYRARHIAFAGLVRDVADLPAVAGGDAEAGIDGFFTDDRLLQADFDFAHARVDLDGDRAPGWTREPGAVSVILEDRPRPFGRAVVNGQVLRVLFDTGSPVSSMTLAAAQRAGMTVAGKPDDDVSGVGTAAPLRAWTSRIPALGLGSRVVRDVPIQVVDKPNASADMIAGFDFFMRHRVWIDAKGHRLVFRMTDDTLF